MKYFYLPACHVIINQHQRNREHANVCHGAHTREEQEQADEDVKAGQDKAERQDTPGSNE